LALLRVGFARPPPFLEAPVRSYRTISPLPRTASASEAVLRGLATPWTRGGVFLWHFPSSRLARVLPGTLARRSSDVPLPSTGSGGKRPPGLLAPLQSSWADRGRSTSLSRAHERRGRRTFLAAPVTLRGRPMASATAIPQQPLFAEQLPTHPFRARRLEDAAPRRGHAGGEPRVPAARALT
jgi:hypothetical protein